jgi:hypothetical protein
MTQRIVGMDAVTVTPPANAMTRPGQPFSTNPSPSVSESVSTTMLGR